MSSNSGDPADGDVQIAQAAGVGVRDAGRVRLALIFSSVNRRGKYMSGLGMVGGTAPIVKYLQYIFKGEKLMPRFPLPYFT